MGCKGCAEKDNTPRIYYLVCNSCLCVATLRAQRQDLELAAKTEGCFNCGEIAITVAENTLQVEKIRKARREVHVGE